MRKVYIDSLNHCHPTKNGNMTAVETDFFDGMCNAFVEGHCIELFDDGSIHKIYPRKRRSELDAAQREYERQLLAEYEAALQTLGVEV